MQLPRRALGSFLLAGLLAAAAACRTSQPLDMTDEGIKTRIMANLEAQRDLDLRYVTVNVHVRIATVSGLVPTYQDQFKIRQIVESTKGVDQAVINLVTQE